MLRSAASIWMASYSAFSMGFISLEKLSLSYKDRWRVPPMCSIVSWNSPIIEILHCSGRVLSSTSSTVDYKLHERLYRESPRLPNFGDSLAHRTLHIDVLKGKIYYNCVIRIHSHQIIRERDTGRVWRNPCVSFLRLSPIHQGLYRMHSVPETKQNKNSKLHMTFLPRQSH